MERTNYMQQCLTATYPGVAVEALSGGFDGAWERLISKKLEKDYQSGNSEAEVIVDSAGGNYEDAAKLIINSKIPQSHE